MSKLRTIFRKITPPNLPTIWAMVLVLLGGVVTQVRSQDSTAIEIRKFQKDFSQAMRKLKKEFSNQIQREMDHAAATRNSRKKDWTRREKNERHQFFKEHTAGAERREFIQSFLLRKKEFEASLKEDEQRFLHEIDVRKQSFREEMKRREKEFQGWISEKKRPPQELFQ